VAYVVQSLADWVTCLASMPGVDSNMVSLLGFSAGAYAVTELLACRHQVRFHALAFGGVHGHGQPDLRGICGKNRIKNADSIKRKWNDYIQRLKFHKGAPGGIFAAHHPNDAMSLWDHAEQICGVLSGRQVAHGFPPCKLEKVALDKSQKKTKSAHNYLESTFLRRELLDKLLLGHDTNQEPANSHYSNSGSENESFWSDTSSSILLLDHGTNQKRELYYSDSGSDSESFWYHPNSSIGRCSSSRGRSSSIRARTRTPPPRMQQRHKIIDLTVFQSLEELKDETSN